MIFFPRLTGQAGFYFISLSMTDLSDILVFYLNHILLSSIIKCAEWLEIPLFVRNDRDYGVFGEENGTASPSHFPPLDLMRNCHSDGGIPSPREGISSKIFLFYNYYESRAKCFTSHCQFLTILKEFE